MAKYVFRLPDIGEGIAEAEIVALHIALGDHIDEDSPLADMMTDKATVEMEAPVSGTVVEIGGAVGDIIAIGSTLVVIETQETDSQLTSVKAETALPAVEVIKTKTVVSEPVLVSTSDRVEAIAPLVVAVQAGVLASPAVRARANALAVPLGDVKPSEDGRVRHADLDAYLRYGNGAGYVAAAPARADEPIRVIGMRRRIAENMALSKRNIPHFTYVEEMDVTALEALRAELNGQRGDRPKLTMLPLLIIAICRTVPRFPMINARYDDEAGVVTRHGAVHLGMATQTDAGLMVPVIRDAQTLNVWQLAREITRLAEAARSGKAKSEELSGSTLTITSLGALGGVATTPVINRPEVAIIGPNRIIERPIFVDNGRGGDEIRRAKLMNLSISCDHRVVDGWDAASYVQAIKRLIETPVLLFAD